jgi:hypothetical protein
MLQRMDYAKYQKFLSDRAKFPDRDHKFVVFEYVESPCDSLITSSERLLPGTPSIHSIISNPLFNDNMKFLFGDSDHMTWYTRRKVDQTKPFEEQLTNVRQLVVMISKEVPLDEEDTLPPLMPVNNPDIYNFCSDDDVPPLMQIPSNNTVLTRDMDNYSDDVPPPLVPIPSYNYFNSGLNQSIWRSQLPYNFTNLVQ